jgi:hypothetical protein
MPRAVTLAVLAAALLLPLAGCGVPDALQRSQSLQLAAMQQYRDEMETYHAKVTSHLAAEKRAQLDAALAASLRQAAGDDGRVTVETALEKTAKRLALEDAFRSERARLDGEFAQRQAAIGRAIDLAEETLDLAASYGRLAALVRNLFVRDAEARRAVTAYESERSPTDAADRSRP